MKSKIKLTVYLIIFISFLVVIGVSFAYFSANIIGLESSTTITASSGEMTITYNDSNPNITASGISPSNDVPFATKTFTVKGTNTTDSKLMPYSLSLVVDENTFSLEALAFSLDSENTSNKGEIVNSISFDPSSVIVLDELFLGTGYFPEGKDTIHTYTLKLYFVDKNKNQVNDMNKSFAAHIKISAPESMDISPKHWKEAASNTLLGKLKSNNTLASPLTNYNRNGALETEKIMGAAPDDYGTSYYFRGTVDNNYVSFANMCWRIVRVTGDGSIKLALYNAASSDCTVSNVDGAFAKDNSNQIILSKYNDSYYKQEFLSNHKSTSIMPSFLNNNVNKKYKTKLLKSEYSSDNAYVGFMYGTAKECSDKNYDDQGSCVSAGKIWKDQNSSSYENAMNNENKSIILENLESWYNLKLSSYISYLSDVIWCNDIYTLDSDYLKNLFEEDYTLGYGTNNTIYSFINRVSTYPEIIGGTGIKYNCQKDNLGGKRSSFTVSDTKYGNGDLSVPIGLLTGDELIYSGFWMENNYPNLFSFLYENASGYPWVTMTPFITGKMISYGSSSSMGGIFSLKTDDLGTIRPAIALKYNINANGSGTSSDPYVIQ